jgi:transposase-like protein
MLQFTEFKSLFDLTKSFSDEAICINHLEAIRWNGNVISPFDETSKVYKCAGFKYKCKKTGKYFNVRTGTIFEDTKVPLQKWFMAIYIFNSHKKGISSHQLAKDIEITQKSAWFLLHRIRYAYSHKNFKKTLQNEVQADESYIGGVDKNRHANKKKWGQGRSDDKTPVIGMLEKDGIVKTEVVPMVTRRTIERVIVENVATKAILITDSFPSYYRVGKKYDHKIINHSKGVYVDNGFHTNGIENFWSQLKRGIYGIYHSVSQKHLQQYCNEFAYRYNTRKIKDNQRFNMYLTSIDKRLTYKALINNE